MIERPYQRVHRPLPDIDTAVSRNMDRFYAICRHVHELLLAIVRRNNNWAYLSLGRYLNKTMGFSKLVGV